MTVGTRAVVTSCASLNRPALVAFLPAGFPDPDRFAASAEACVRGGADILEVGIADDAPEMEGDVVRRAFAAAARHDAATLRDCLQLAASLAPVIAMTYEPNASDAAAFAAVCADLGVGEVLVPDLAITQQLRLAEEAPVGVGVFAARREDVEQIRAARSRLAFAYVRSSRQPTGQPLDVGRAVTRLRDVNQTLGRTDIPVLIGFGIERAEHASLLATEGADGIVVGSAVVRAAERGPEAVEELVAALSEALAEMAASR